MRHHKTGRKLSRTSSHRMVLQRNLFQSLIVHESIKTTLPKAKELRRVAERLITRAKEDSVANRRLVSSRLGNGDKAVIAKLFIEIAPRYKLRPGGYCRILKCGFRAGDQAPMAIIQLVEEAMPASKSKEKKVPPKRIVPVVPAVQPIDKGSAESSNPLD